MDRLNDWEYVLLEWDRKNNGKVASREVAERVIAMILKGRELWHCSEYERDTIGNLRRTPIEQTPVVVQMRMRAVKRNAILNTTEARKSPKRAMRALRLADIELTEGEQ